MRLRGRQLRFLVGLLAAWSGLRWAYVSFGAVLVGAGLPSTSAIEPAPWRDPARLPNFRAAPAWRPVPHLTRIAPALPIAFQSAIDRQPPGRTAVILPRPVPDRRSMSQAAGTALLDRPTSIPRAPVTVEHPRWTAALYLYGRPTRSGATLAEGGQLGGSQFALRVAYRLNAHGPTRIAAAARLYVPIGAKGAEAAAGLDWYPAPSVPVRLTVERRTGIDHAGREAWSAYAAGGFYREAFGHRLAIDGYGQAGMVGVRSRDAFVDGSLRAGGRIGLGRTILTLGGGAWGAAQPDLARLDVGPRAALTVPVADRAFTVAVEGRFRIAGQARPGSGVALTLGMDL